MAVDSAEHVPFDRSSGAFVMGLGDEAVGVVRALGRSGIRVVGFDWADEIAAHSRYVREVIRTPHPVTAPKGFVEVIAERALLEEAKPVFFVTTDELLPMIADYQDTLRELGMLRVSSPEVLTMLRSKIEQVRMADRVGVGAPRSVLVSSLADLTTVRRVLAFPVLLKGASSIEWREEFGEVKGLVAHDHTQLEDHAGSILDKGLDALAQEVVPGPAKSSHFVYAYIDEHGHPLRTFMSRKLRQLPYGFGVGTSFESTDNREVLEIGLRFLSGIGYRGFGFVEFKYDPSDRRWKLMELNARYPMGTTLPAFCGVTFPLVEYLDLTQQRVPPQSPPIVGLKKVSVLPELRAALEERRWEGLTFREWTRTLAGRRVYYPGAWDDPGPLLYVLRQVANRRILRKAAR